MEEGERAPSLLARAGFAVALLAVLVVALYALLHMSLRPINPAQKTPEGHFTARCSLCHAVSEGAQLVE